MLVIDRIFTMYMICLVLYIQLTPGTQMIPPWWKPKERMNWKPTMFSWINMIIVGSYIFFRNFYRF